MKGTLAVSGERRASPENGPFAVVFAAPSGEATSAAELSFVFSRPVRLLETAEEASIPPITVTPPIAGQWLWVGTKALRFVPAAQRLPGAQHYVVEVPGTLRSLDGSALGKPYRLEFTTSPPRVVGQKPALGQEGMALDTTFTFEWNQPVDPAAVEKAATLVATRGKQSTRLALYAKRLAPNQPKKMLIGAKGKLPKDSTIELRIAATLVGEEGPVPMGTPSVFSFQTYAPLSVQRFDCDTDTPHGGCAPGGSIGISLTNPVKRADFLRAVSVDPPIKLPKANGDEDTAMYLGLSSAFAPGQSYTVTIAKELTDQYGQSLGTPYKKTIVVDDYFPHAEIGLSGDTLVASAIRPIEIGTVNLPSLDLASASVGPAELPALLDPENPGNFDKVVQLKNARRRRITVGAAKNTLARSPYSISEALPKNRGVLALAVDYRKDPKDYRGSGKSYNLLKVTNLGISAKVSKFGTLVWVTRLDSGAPVEGASVGIQVKGKPVGASYPTDAQGFARLPEGAYEPAYERDYAALLVVSKDEDWTFEQFSAHLPEWRLPVPVDLSGVQRTYGMLFSERGVYRPGDTVKTKGILRQETKTGNAVPAGKKLTLVLSSPEGEQISRTPVVTSRFGTFATDLKVPATAALGDFVMRVLADGAEEPVASESFHVAEYRPAEFKVTADSNAPSYVRGGTASFTVHGDYLFGAPMPGAKVTYNVSHGPTFFDVPGTEGFSTDSRPYYSDLPEQSLDYSLVQSTEATLDPQGGLSFSAKVPMPGQRYTETLRFDAEVTDVSRQSIASGASALVHPADFYVGLRMPDDYFVAAPGDVQVSAIAVAPDGKRLSGKAVHLELVHRRWTMARETTKSGETHTVSKVVDQPAGACDVTTASAPAACKLHAEKTGYYVVVARAKDARGNAAEAAYGMYATGEGGGASFADNDDASVALVPNKKQYSVGDTAKVLVKSPFAEAEALVTVERAGVYYSQRVTLKGAATAVSVPVTDDLRPNAYVSVHLLRSAKVKGVGPLYRVGYTELRIDAEARRLKIDVKPNKGDFKPGEEVTVDVAARTVKGEPAAAELTVYAVDEGVLMLTGYRAPDPLPVFTAPRPLQVATLETRENMAKISLDDMVLAMGSDKGDEGGGGPDAQGARQDFRTTAYFNPSVVTDASGRAQVKFKLPDNLTSFRIMAVAAAETDRYGFGASTITTSKRLMARPNLPRFLRAGDRAEAGIVVSSKGLAKSQVTVKAAVTGLVLDGAAERTVEVPQGGSVEVRFPFRADTAGKASFRFDVAGGNEKDAVQVTRDVQVPGKLEAVALYGSTTEAIGEGLGDMSAIRRDVGSLDVSVSPSALVGLDGSVLSLVEYPYQCTEQLSSRLLPLVPLRDLAQKFGFAMPANAGPLVGQTIRDIVARQQSSGGFGMWPESPRPEPFVSAYATWALHEAAAHGEKIPQSVFDRAHGYLRTVLAALDLDPLRVATAAMVVDVLASSGSPDPGYMAKLFETRKSLPLFGRAFLLHALAVGKGPPDAVKTLAAEVSSELRIANDTALPAENVGDDYAVLLDSTARTTALVLRAIMAADPNHALAAPLARGLLSLRRDGSFRTTQETAFALVALDDYRKVREATPAKFSARAWLGGTEFLDTKFDGTLRAEHVTLPLAKVPEKAGNGLVFQKSGPGTLFYEARLRYARKTLPATPLDAGFFVQKALRAVDPQSLPKAILSVASTGVTQFKAGDLVLADLVVVTAGARDYVVVDDPLPAGFEAVDTGLATTASWLAEPGSSTVTDSGNGEDCDDCESARDAQAHGRAFGWSWYRQEVRDDRVLFFVDHMAAGMYHYRYLARATTSGTFVTPPTSAEEMYTPETFGRTGAVSIVIQ